MISVFDACLEVDKLERAALVLERLSAREDMHYPTLISLHNRYLRAGIDRALDQPETEWAQSLHRWFEMKIRAKNIPHTPETIACMLKISLLSAKGERLTRLVTRYLDMLPEESLWSVLDAGILSQQDFGTVADIYQPISKLTVDEWDSLVDTQSEDAPAPLVEALPLEDSSDKSTPVPDVLPVPQKGLGLKSLRSVLSFFNEIEGRDLSKLSMDERREIQARLEQDCVEAAIERWREENQALAKMGRSTAIATKALNPQLYEWQQALEKALQREFDLFDVSETCDKKSKEDLERCLYAPFMRQSTPARLAAVTIMAVLNTLAHQGADKGVSLTTLLTTLAKVVEEDIRFQIRQRQVKERKASFRRKHAQRLRTFKERINNSVSEANGESAPTQDSSHILRVPTYDNTSWPALIKAKVGSQLLSALFSAAKIEVVREHPETKVLISQMQPALARAAVHRKGKKIGMVMPNKVLVNLLKREPRGDYLARHLPMLVEPLPWTRFDRGGFLEFPSQLVRVKNGERDQRIYTEAAILRGDLDQSLT
ncbi:hypothetical protein ONZ43_g6971 [Nemania bipapillata]|uniref:Uncharacterized protein n=1 Tax=Nemania bipapillata TaxID=110536 RepID=A0ACC2HV94_9PEZI|nr:hypothetical protein ONZ43_g6971 [Nemania bipapillata]